MGAEVGRGSSSTKKSNKPNYLTSSQVGFCPAVPRVQ